ncbi:MAG: galactose mutarotase [Candidatus Aenigmarchaeota archaeon]|nr:galactose mutarotase [Candidatus Aenigmarchaeota archaeon]
MDRFKIEESNFGTLQGEGVAGTEVNKIKLLDQEYGNNIVVCPFGATWVGGSFRGIDGDLGDVVLGFDNTGAYENGTSSQGATVGRYAGRIGNASFKLDGAKHELTKNQGENSIHGGAKGFNKHLWHWTDRKVGDKFASVEFSKLSPDGEEGYPGNVCAYVTYFLTPRGVKIRYRAVTDRSTVINLTNHAYFNLAGTDGKTVDGHIVCIDAPQYLQTDENLIPTGTFLPVWGDRDNTREKDLRVDLRNPIIIGDAEFDHSYAFEDDGGWHMAFLYDPESGRLLNARTSERCIQFYTGNFLGKDKNGTPDAEGLIYKQGACLECQRFPDAPNHHGNIGAYRLDLGLPYQKTDVFEFTAAPDLGQALKNNFENFRMEL